MSPEPDMTDVFKTLRAEKHTLTQGAFKCRAYRTGIRRAKDAGWSPDDALDFGHSQFAKAADMWRS